ncbi:MAG: mercury transporter MerT [Proteobacteria bacterium]|nr:mercury transporter MerT [Pseudomonadota bacterium]
MSEHSHLAARAAPIAGNEPGSSAVTGAGHGQTLAAAGGLLGALAASSCCILPVVLFSLGISGAWIGNFTQLAPYKPYFITATIAFLGVGYWLVHRASKRVCAESEACARPLANGLVKSVLIAATVLVVAAFGFDYVAPYLLS